MGTLENIWEKITGIGELKSKLQEANLLQAACETKYDMDENVIKGQNSTISTLNKAIAQDNLDKQLLATQVDDLTEKYQEVLAKMASWTQATFFQKPCPALLQHEPKEHVMLGAFQVTTRQGTNWYYYPDHPSFFMPIPWMERMLDAADCNRKRDDISEVRVATLISNVFQRNFRYIDDQTQWGAPDNWTPTPVTLALGQDNCENLAANIVACIHLYEMKYGAFRDYSVMEALGLYKAGTSSTGHGFVLLLHNASTGLKDSYIIEGTLNYPANPKTIADVRAIYGCEWGIIGPRRADYKDGTYFVQPAYQWWLSTGAKTKEGIIDRLLERFGFKTSPDRQKYEHMQNFWRDRRVG